MQQVDGLKPPPGKTMHRAGSRALALLSLPLNVRILSSLAEGPKGLKDLNRLVGLPPESTLRLYLKTLMELGAIEGAREDELPTSVDYRLTDSGKALLDVGTALEDWLGNRPGGATGLGTPDARSSIQALIEGWLTNILRALAVRSLSLTELNSLIPRVSYPALERRLSAMRLVGLLEINRTGGRSRPYLVTEWLRRAVVPITAAVGWERTYIPELTFPVGRLDVETAFLLAIPLMRLDSGMTGRCRLAVEVQNGSSPVFVGVLVGIGGGRVTSCVTNLEGEVEAWATGKPIDWLRQMNAPEIRALDIGGDASLVQAIADALRRTGSEPNN